MSKPVCRCYPSILLAPEVLSLTWIKEIPGRGARLGFDPARGRIQADGNTMKKLLSAIVAAATIVAASAATAAGPSPADASKIEEIVVVANKNERPLREIAANVTVVSAAEIAAEMATSVADVLGYLPGIDAEGAGTRFGSEGINIRGIGGNRVALLIDGVPLSDQFAVGSFSNATRDLIDTGFVERAEILHGPASALYGSSAIGGVVALRTPEPAELTGQKAGGGRLDTTWRDADSSAHATLLQGFRFGKSAVLAGISLRDGREPEPAASAERLDRRKYERLTGILKYRRDDVLGHTLGLAWYTQELAVESSLESMLGSGRFRSTTALEGDDRQRLDLVSAEYRFGAAGGLLDEGLLRAYAGKTDVEQQTHDERGLAARPVLIERFFSFEQEFRGLELNLHKLVSRDRAEHRLGFGMEYRDRRSEEYRDGLETGLEDGLQTNVLLGEVFPLRDFPISESTDLGIYVEDAFSYGAWTVIAAVRGDRYELEPANDALYAEDYPFASPVALTESDLSPKLGIIYRPLESVDLYLQYAHGFRAPPYEDANIGLELPVFNYRAIPNPDLRSETSDGFDLGVRWTGTAASARLSLFHTRYDDFIESRVRLGPDPVSGRILFQSQNLRRATIEGIEAGWTIDFGASPGGLSFSGSVYYARGENVDSGEPLNSVGPPQAVMMLDWAPDSSAWQMRLAATLTGGWTDRDETGGDLFEPPGHAVFDLFVTRSIGAHMRLRAGLSNLTDRSYWAWSDVRGLSPDDPVIPFLARPGRSASVSVDMNW